jgi:DNA-binding CsgD family transcriptional regulator
MSAVDCVSNWAVVAPMPMVLVDADRRVQWQNQAGGEYLATQASLVVQDGCLDMAREPLRPRLAHLIASAGPQPTLHALGQGPEDACLVTAQRLSPPHDPLIMLLLRPSGSERWRDGLPLANIAGLFDLTGTETVVVGRLMSSQSPVDIARALDIKLGTIRTHVRNIYAKMGVNTREGLFLRCLPFAWLDAPG